MVATAREFGKLCRVRYGVDAIVVGSCHPVEWTALHIAETVGQDVAVRLLRQVNRQREKRGLRGYYPERGDTLWEAYYQG